jgi:hypothetical protein
LQQDQKGSHIVAAVTGYKNKKNNFKLEVKNDQILYIELLGTTIANIV